MKIPQQFGSTFFNQQNFVYKILYTKFSSICFNNLYADLLNITFKMY